MPAVNIKPPFRPCASDTRNPRCPPNGILLDPEISCHLLDENCPPTGVIVPQIPCPGKAECPCGSRLPPWIQLCRKGESNCPFGFIIVNPPTWPPVGAGHKYPNPIPGYVFNPNNFCSPVNDACWDPNHGVVVDTDATCDARQPGCLALDVIHNPQPAGNDPKCPPGHNCVIVNMIPCHKNDPHKPEGCMMVSILHTPSPNSDQH